MQQPKSQNTLSLLSPRALLCLILASLIVNGTVAPYAQAQDDDDIERLFQDEGGDEGDTGAFQSAPVPPPPPDFNDNAAGVPSDNNFGGGDSGRFPTPQGSGRTSSGPSTTVKPIKTSNAAKKKVPLSDANIEDITNENYPDLIESFDYPNAEITDVIKAMGQLTGKNFIVDPAVRGKVSIIAPSRITVAEAWKAFLAALAINQYTVVPYGKFLKVKSTRNAGRDSIDTFSGDYFPNSDVLITRIVHLKHTSAEEIRKRLNILPSKDGEITPYEPTNSLIITDFGSNVERIMKILNELDRPGFEEQLAVVPIRHAKVKDLADLINQIINKEASRGGAAGAPGGSGFGAGVPRFRATRPGGAGTGTTEELSLVAPDERTNALIVVGNKAGIQKIKDLVKKLDYKLDPAEAGGVFVYYVKFGEADKIQQTLNGIAQGTSSTPGGGGASALPSRFGAQASPTAQQSIFGGDVKITADKGINALVITASRQDYQTVLTILSKLDIPKDQVFIEAIIMELNSAKIRQWNPNVYNFLPGENNSQGIARQGFITSPVSSIINPAGDQGMILGFGGGKKMTLNLGTAGNITIPNLIGFIQLLQQTTESNILSTPQLLAADNEPAEIEVGDDIPVAQQSTSTTTGTSQGVQFKKASIKLALTPFIRPDSEKVRLKIDQLSVAQPSNQPSRNAALAESTVTISDRTIKTNITLNNGDTAVLGGLIRDEEGVTEKKVPLLGDIPILGWLFKSRQTNTNKVNLVVFLTPKIIRNISDSQKNLGNVLGKRIDWIKKNFDGRDPYGKKIDEMPRAAATDDESSTAGVKSNGQN